MNRASSKISRLHDESTILIQHEHIPISMTFGVELFLIVRQFPSGIHPPYSSLRFAFTVAPQ